MFLVYSLVDHASEIAGANINPDLLLAAFLPALLFESAFSMEAHQIKVNFQVCLSDEI
jgi:NhaP-type Na+/H+ or K+/H+ antiporter